MKSYAWMYDIYMVEMFTGGKSFSHALGVGAGLFGNWLEPAKTSFVAVPRVLFFLFYPWLLQALLFVWK